MAEARCAWPISVLFWRIGEQYVPSARYFHTRPHTHTCTGDMPPDGEAAAPEESSLRSPRTPAVASRGIAAARSASRGKGFLILTFALPCNTRFEVTVNQAKRRFERSLGLSWDVTTTSQFVVWWEVIGRRRYAETSRGSSAEPLSAWSRVTQANVLVRVRSYFWEVVAGRNRTPRHDFTAPFLNLYTSYPFTVLTPLTPLTPLRLSSHPAYPLYTSYPFHPSYPFHAAYFFYLACPLTPLTFSPQVPSVSASRCLRCHGEVKTRVTRARRPGSGRQTSDHEWI